MGYPTNKYGLPDSLILNGQGGVGVNIPCIVTL